MSLLHEIQSQKPTVRYALFGLSVFVVISTIGFLWVGSFQREVFMALHDNADERAAFLAQQGASLPDPLAKLTHGVASLAASIGGLIGLQNSKGFDRTGPNAQVPDVVHLLPLSN